MPTKDNHRFFVVLDHPEKHVPVPIVDEAGDILLFRTCDHARDWARESPIAQTWGYWVYSYIDRSRTPWRGFGESNDIIELKKRRNKKCE